MAPKSDRTLRSTGRFFVEFWKGKAACVKKQKSNLPESKGKVAE